MAQAPSLPTLAWQAFVLLSVSASAVIVWRLARPRGEWGARLRARFVLGVPWGTLLTVGLVTAVYLLVQGGLWHWRRPVVIAFRAWSYLYPLGIVTAGLSHAGPGHLIGNLLATVTFGVLAEYAWGHFPTERGASTFSSLRTNPYARIAAVPAVAVLGAIYSGAFALGPVIGFSGVVFALAGFALIRYPLTTLVLLALGDAVSLVYRALQNPQVFAEASPSFQTPWWANIAIQGHSIGLLAGIVVAVVLFHRRNEVPSPARLWAGVVGFSAAQGLWAVYLILGNGRFVLYRGLGISLVLLLGAMIAAAVASSDRVVASTIDLSWRDLGVILVASVFLALSAVAVPFNLMEVGSGAVPSNATTVEAGDYTVFYAENVENPLVAAVDVPGYNGSTVRQSGVIVVSRQREIWSTAISTQRLAFEGRSVVVLGGPGWRERVVATRAGWSVVGGPSTYKVFLKPSNEPRRLAFTASNATAEPVIDGRNVSIVPTRRGFAVRVSRDNETLGTAPIPKGNASASAGGLEFVREGDKLFAVGNDSRVRVASRNGE